MVRMILSFNSSSNLFFCDFVLKGKKNGGERLTNHGNVNKVSVKVQKSYSLEFRFLLFLLYKAINSKKKTQTFQTYVESCTALMAHPVRKKMLHMLLIEHY